MAGSDKGGNKDGDTEDVLWRRVKDATRPLSHKKRPAPAVAKAPAKKATPAPMVAAPSPSAPAPAIARAGGLDRRHAERLRRGQLPIESTLDLHGLTQAEAHGALNTHLLRAYHEGRRTVLVITGKGAGKAGGGVLRANVPRWLGEAPLANIVLEQVPARGRDGGGGALYVRLRKLR